MTGKPLTRILEVAAGPARHAITALTTFADTLQGVYCIDNAAAMQQYATETARQELASDADFEKFHYLTGDMRDDKAYTTDMLPVDSAWILLGSLQHMTTNDDVRQCLRAVHKALTAGGTCMIELPHPRESHFNRDNVAPGNYLGPHSPGKPPRYPLSRLPAR